MTLRREREDSRTSGPRFAMEDGEEVGMGLQ